MSYDHAYHGANGRMVLHKSLKDAYSACGNGQGPMLAASPSRQPQPQQQYVSATADSNSNSSSHSPNQDVYGMLQPLLPSSSPTEEAVSASSSYTPLLARRSTAYSHLSRQPSNPEHTAAAASIPTTTTTPTTTPANGDNLYHRLPTARTQSGSDARHQTSSSRSGALDEYAQWLPLDPSPVAAVGGLVGAVTQQQQQQQQRRRQPALAPGAPVPVWYHGKVSRDQAEARLRCVGAVPGQFLVREKEADAVYAISVCFKTPSGVVKIMHHLLERGVRQSGGEAAAHWVLNDKFRLYDCLTLEDVIRLLRTNHGLAGHPSLGQPCCLPAELNGMALVH